MLVIPLEGERGCKAISADRETYTNNHNISLLLGHCRVDSLNIKEMFFSFRSLNFHFSFLFGNRFPLVQGTPLYTLSPISINTSKALYPSNTHHLTVSNPLRFRKPAPSPFDICLTSTDLALHSMALAELKVLIKPLAEFLLSGLKAALF